MKRKRKLGFGVKKERRKKNGTFQVEGYSNTTGAGTPPI